MRTTIELPEELHQRVEALARDTARSVEETIAELVQRGLDESPGKISRSERTGLLVIDTGKVITPEDVRSLEDDDLDDSA